MHVVTVAAEDALSGGDGHGPTADHADCTEQEPCDWALTAVGRARQVLPWRSRPTIAARQREAFGRHSVEPHASAIERGGVPRVE